MYTGKPVFSPPPSSEPTLTYCMQVFGSDGNIESDSCVESNQDIKMPMASTVKIAIALALAKIEQKCDS